MNKIFFLFLSLFLATSVAAQDSKYPVSEISPLLQLSADQVFRLDYLKWEVKSPKQAQEHVIQSVTVLNEDGDFQPSVGYDDDSKITKLSVVIYDRLGNKVKTLRKGDFTDQSAVGGGTIYSDSRVKYVSIPYNTYPYTVEFEYKKQHNNLLYYPETVLNSYGVATEKFVFKVVMPRSIPIRHQSVNHDLKPTIEESEKQISYTWEAKNLPAIPYEVYAPYRDQIIPSIQVIPSHFQYDDYEGDMTSWEKIGHFFYQLNDGRDELSQEMKDAVQELTAGLESDQEKIEVLYDYLQDNMRYVSVQLGIGGWQTFKASYVEKNKYGDCKALSNFMKAMLQEAGISAQLAVINRSLRNKYEWDNDFSYPKANHMLLHLPEQDMWLECTSNNYPVNYLGADNADRPALLITEKGGVIKRTPKLSAKDNAQKSDALIKIAADGSAFVQNQVNLEGLAQDYYRYVHNEWSQEKIEQEFPEWLSLPSFNIRSLVVLPETEAPTTLLRYALEVPRYASKAGKRLFIPLNKLSSFDNVPTVNEQRIHPVHVKQTYLEDDTYTFELPEGYEVESIPEKLIELDSKYGKYTIKVEVNKQKMTYHRYLEIYDIQLPAEEYNELRNFYKKIAAADDMKVVLVKRKT